MHFTDTSEAVRAWVHGWALSRGAGEPSPTPWGFTVVTGPPGNSTNHVLPTADETTVRELTRSPARPGVWLKAFVPADSLASWIAPGWSIPGAPGFLMSTSLGSDPAGVPSAAPDGYRLRSWTDAGVVHARVHAPDGTTAARGQTAVDGTTAVVDKVETHTAHRRRGLGRVIMATLTATAAEQGATVGLLASSAEGRTLYEATGWLVAAPWPTPGGGRTRPADTPSGLPPHRRSTGSGIHGAWARTGPHPCRAHDPAASGYAYS